MYLNKTNPFSNLRNATIALCALLCLSSAGLQADILAYWDDWAGGTAGSVADDALTGFSGSMTNSGANNVNNTFGSSDGTFGDDILGAATGANGLLVNAVNSQDTLTFTITNSTGQDYDIESLHFDFAPRENGNEAANGFNSFVLSYVSGGLGPLSTEIDTQSGLSNVITDGSTNKFSAYPGYDYTLSNSLTDTILSHTESATFSIVFSGQTPDDGGAGNEGKNTSSVLDNLAFTGTAVIPEPSSLVLLLVSGLGVVCLRRRKA